MFINLPTQGQKTMVTMEIKLKALKFEASDQLAAFVDKKVSRLERFCEDLTN